MILDSGLLFLGHPVYIEIHLDDRLHDLLIALLFFYVLQLPGCFNLVSF